MISKANSDWNLAQDITSEIRIFFCIRHSWREAALLRNKADSAGSISKKFWEGFLRITLNDFIYLNFKSLMLCK